MIRQFVLTSVFALTFSQGSYAKSYQSEGQNFEFQTLTQQKDTVWGFDFLPDGKIIFTERSGVLKIFDPKTKATQVIKGTPQVWASGQGGLLDVRVLPGSANKIYLTYSEPIGQGATTALASATLNGAELQNLKKLFSAQDANSNAIHFGSRIEFDGKGHVFITVGDRNNRPQVQSLGYHLGKSIRLNEDGTVPLDNPFVKINGAKPEIWTLGHRSPQGLFRNPVSGDLWLVEMGPFGGDEINLLKPGANYGWPVVTYGREYTGEKIGEGTEKPGMESPVAYWVPSISPSGANIYQGDVFPKWKGNIFLGNLGGTHLRRLAMADRKVVKQEELLKDLGLRFRNVRPGPDGFLYLSTDDGKIARLIPAK
ncbi:PQQ-dependent sugar dehydrogenase [Bdellovibrio sp. HCB337]|uniref:PQQ-dependent sugar dehydrogenase n=1 Tax=Bdellovibrio sp. HCB337 TaxID=3394358 RepID=UPI0039A60A59